MSEDTVQLPCARGILGVIGIPDITALAQSFIARHPEHREIARAVLNGAIGDRLHEAGSPLATQPRLLFGLDKAETLEALEPSQDPTRICVFVHGLMGCEHDWTFWSKGNEDKLDYAETLTKQRDVLPVFARYNSGLHISTNGRALSARLEALVEQSPQLREITIVAHSMGGLVTRSACHYAVTQGHTWQEKLQRVFLLGVPTHGAPLEQLAHIAAFTLDAIWNPWTKLVGKAINLRSAGIKDLRHGFVLDEDWQGRDPDQLRLAAPRAPSSAPHVQWYVAAASLGSMDSTWGKMLGDGAVRTPSASGKGFGTPAPGLLAQAVVRVFDHTSHAALLSDPAVIKQLLDWWD
ncbi:MAG: alpha/beta hydrolase [Nannocystaceae bacterium]|nr:alpha/beta hydrolase [Nannocystaceae bacterium]